MVVPIRELVNILFPSTTKDSKFDPMILDSYSMNIDINIPRGRISSLSINSLRVSLAHSNISSISYHERIIIQNNDLSWSEQVENKEERFSLSYTTLKIEEKILANEAVEKNLKDRAHYANNEALTLNNMFNSQGENEVSNNTNTYVLQNVIEVFLPYNIQKLVEPNSWDSKAYLITIFGTIEFLNTDTRNIYTSLLCILDFIKKKSTSYNQINDVTQLEGFE